MKVFGCLVLSLFSVGLIIGCPRVIDLAALDDVVVGDDLDVGGQVNAGSGNIGGVEIDEDGNVRVPGDLTVGGDIMELPEPPLPPPLPLPPPIDEPPSPVIPAVLTAAIKALNNQTLFDIGESINLEVIAVGGTPLYGLRCLWPDAQFTVVNESSVSRFQFSRQIAIPGSGTINCRITSNDGQTANVWYAIIVE